MRVWLKVSLGCLTLGILMPILGTINGYYLEVATQVGIFVALALGLNVVVGLAGLRDLGYVAFYAKHFTGSRAIARWSHYMFGLERDKQASDPVVRQTTTFRVLKDRFAGSATGEKFGLHYDRNTGYLNECPLIEDMPL